MRTPVYGGPVLCIGAAWALAACGSAFGPPAPGAIGGARAAVSAKSGALLYISDLGANDVAVYSYPAGSLTQKLTGFGSVAGLCSDKAGDVFVVDEAGPVQVFAHGGSAPIRKLATSGAPYGCSVDPASGDLALTQLSAYLDGAMAIYPKANGKPRVIVDKNVDATWFCGYDAKGNVFADAWDRYGKNILLELPKGGKAFKKFALPAKFNKPGGVQWDGKYVAVGDQGAGLIDRMTETGHLANTVTLKGGTNVEQFWISGSTLIGPNAQSPGTAPLWHYPAGGAAYKTISGLTYPFGATISGG